MEIDKSSVYSFLDSKNTVYIVPVYQRNYSWKREQCKQLFNDIVKVIETQKEHFLGTICFKAESNRKLNIIDGQQRLVTISLFLKALYDCTDDEDLKDTIKEDYLYNRKPKDKFHEVRLHLNKNDDKVYNLLLENNKETVDKHLSVKEKRSNVYLNYLLFCDWIKVYHNNGGVIVNLDELLGNLTIVALEIQSENPQEIFESLNSTGLDLTAVDLLRNYFLMRFPYEQQKELYDNYWSKIEDLIGEERMNSFFTDYLLFRRRTYAISVNGRRRKIVGKWLYDCFKAYYNLISQDTSFEKTKSLFADMTRCAELYRNFIFVDDINFSCETELRKKLYFMLKMGELSKTFCLLLYIFDLFDRGLINEVQLMESIDVLSSLTFRMKICNRKGTSIQFMCSIMFRLNQLKDYSNFINALWMSVTSGNGSYEFPSDGDFVDALINRDLYFSLGSTGMKYFLYMLEMHCPMNKGLPMFNENSLSIEHIMPQTLTSQWKAYLSDETLRDRSVLLHRLGNLALTNYNSEMSNKSFDEKKPYYRGSNFYYTKPLAQCDKWQKEEIEGRSRMLAHEARKVWRLPDKYRKMKAIRNEMHTLDEETAQYSFTKPKELYVGSKTIRIDNWREFFSIVLKNLDDDNHDIFMDIVSNNFSGLLKLDDNGEYTNNKVYINVLYNIYVKALSASDIVKNLRRIVKTYDEVTGSEFMNTISFTIK